MMKEAGDVMKNRTTTLFAVSAGLVACLDAGSAFAQTAPMTLPMAQPSTAGASVAPAPSAFSNVQIEGQQPAAAPRGSYLASPGAGAAGGPGQSPTVIGADGAPSGSPTVQDNGQGDGQWVYLNNTGWSWVPSSAS